MVVFYNVKGGKQISYMDMLNATASEELNDYDSPENEKNTNPQEAVRVLNDVVETIGIEPTTS